MIQAGSSSSIPPPSTPTSANCNDPNAFKVAIIDSGVYTQHPDLACSSTQNNNCIGQAFGAAVGLPWDNPISMHGTFVAGILGGLQNNNKGIAGVVDGTSVCWIIGRVFGDDEPTGNLGGVLQAVQWAVDEMGAHVVNLSLGSKSDTESAQALFQELYERGVLVVAAAGNDGNSELKYPASYETVLSVASVGPDFQRSDFSQYNSAVDLAAPGEQIVSTTPLAMKLYMVQAGTVAFAAQRVEGSAPSAQYENGVGGNLIQCDDQSECKGDNQNVCLIPYKGQVILPWAIDTCRAVVIAIPPNTILSLPPELNLNQVPMLSVSVTDGDTLLQEHLGTNVDLSREDGYSTGQGTSFAAPYVAGVAVALMQACRPCTNVQVIECLETTALDLGTPGRDAEYGHGLVQMQSAYECLVDMGCCEDNPTGSPTISPTTSPTNSPSHTPTTSPTDTTPSPTASPSLVSSLTPSTDWNWEQACDAGQSAYRNCLDTLEDKDSCMACVRTSLPSGVASCDDMARDVCSMECEACSGCSSQVQDFLACFYQSEFDCEIDCQDDPVSTQAPSSVPEVGVWERECAETQEAYRTCVDSFDSESCVACIRTSLPSGLATCEDMKDDICNLECDCGICQLLVREFLSCFYGAEFSCGIYCGEPSDVGQAGHELSVNDASSKLKYILSQDESFASVARVVSWVACLWIPVALWLY